MKRAKGVLDKQPEELLIQRVVYATAQSDILLIAMKYRELVPVARQGQFEEKVQEISKEAEGDLETKNGESRAPPST